MSNYDAHFERLNGSMDKTAKALANLTLAIQQLRDQRASDSVTREDTNKLILAVQRLEDQHASDAATLIATAKALKESAEALQIKQAAEITRSEQRWSPWARLGTAVGIVVAIVGVFLAIYANTR